MDKRLKISPFEGRHADGVLIHDYEFLAANIEVWPEAISVFWGGELIAVVGGMTDEGMVSGWVVFTERVTTPAFLAFHRAMRAAIKQYKSDGRGVFIHVDPANPKGQRWAGLMGFSFVREELVQGKIRQRFEQ